MIDILLNRTYYFPTNMIEGQIRLRVPSQTMVKCLKLRFYKKQKLLLKKIDGTTPQILIDEERVSRETMHVFCQNCELEAGEHVFPFRLKLKYEENGTGKVKGYFYDSVCHVENLCMMEGTCTTHNSEYSTEKTVAIFDKSEEKCQTDVKIKTSTILCFFDRTILYRILLDKLWYFRGDLITVDCFSVTKTSHPVVAGVTGKLYQLIVMNRPGDSQVKPRLMCSSAGFPSNKNRFKLQFRIPMGAGPSITEGDFIIRMLLFLELKLYNGTVLKVKKYLNIGEPCVEIPQIEQRKFAKGMLFVEKVLEY